MATATSSTRNTDGKYVCDECGETFDTPQAFGGHATGHKHAQHIQRENEQRFSVRAQVAESLREIVAPLRVQLAEINARIDTTQSELTDLRAARTQLEGAINKIAPNTQLPKKTGAGGSAGAVASRSLEAKKETLRTLIAEKPELFDDGITANALAEYWQRENLQPAASLQSLRTVIEQLRDEGITRADRVTKGGGMSWKLVTSANGGSSAE